MTTTPKLTDILEQISQVRLSMLLWNYLLNEIYRSVWDFPGGPVAKTPYF